MQEYSLLHSFWNELCTKLVIPRASLVRKNGFVAESNGSMSQQAADSREVVPWISKAGRSLSCAVFLKLLRE
jgi:hypothetical protein